MTIFIFDHGYNDKNLCLNTTTGEMHVVPVADWKKLLIPNLTAGDLVITEDAHVIPRTRKSMSQPCTHEENLEIKRIADEREIEIRTMSQNQTASLRSKYYEQINNAAGKYLSLLDPAARDKDKNEVRDILAWHFHIIEHPTITRQFKKYNPQSPEEHAKRSEEIWIARDLLNIDLNVARSGGVKVCYRHEDDLISRWIHANVDYIESIFTPEQLQVLDWYVKNRGKANQYVDDKPQKRLYTLLATLVQPDGKLRTRTVLTAGTLQEKVPYWKYVKRVFFGMTPFHQRAGVAASNVKWWWRMFGSPFPKGAAQRHADDVGFRNGRSYMDRQIRDIWRTLRQSVIDNSKDGKLVA